jgi:hypothetical protein
VSFSSAFFSFLLFLIAVSLFSILYSILLFVFGGAVQCDVSNFRECEEDENAVGTVDIKEFFPGKSYYFLSLSPQQIAVVSMLFC